LTNTYKPDRAVATALFTVGTALTTLASGWQTVLVNNCPFNIYFRISSGLLGDVNQMSPLGPGGHISIWDEPRSLAIKVNKDGDRSRVLQAEADIHDGALWYNWSDDSAKTSEGQNPFLGDHRGMYFGGVNGCPDLVCMPGENSCNWAQDVPLIKTCASPGYAQVVLC
jgi:hypothetical protein